MHSHWHAARNVAAAAEVASELGNVREVADLTRRAAMLYLEAGRGQPASDVYAKGARAIEERDSKVRVYLRPPGYSSQQC